MISMTAEEIVKELKSLGKESYKRTLMKHGAPEPIYGVSIEDLKKIQKRVKMNYPLALELYETGISEAMYLAGLITDDSKMTREDLQHWVEKAHFSLHSENTVPWVASGSPHGYDLALEWIESDKPNIASSGWATLSSLVSTKADSELDIPKLKQLLNRVSNTIHEQPNRVRSTMNGFVIAAGTYAADLTEDALAAADKIGKVSVDAGGTACKVAFAPDYIKKALEKGVTKRKSAKC